MTASQQVDRACSAYEPAEGTMMEIERAVVSVQYVQASNHQFEMIVIVGGRQFNQRCAARQWSRRMDSWRCALLSLEVHHVHYTV